MATFTTPKDRADTAREMILQEADFLEAEFKKLWPYYTPRPGDVNFRAGQIKGLRQAADSLGEGKGV